ncbi:DUF7715 family protein [Nonomuraea glycinis]|uniref:DUF7715 family protein n=1 Tax=Nonomuraea glycinis TaxID=2047744 RepID=UPI002E136E87|nr:hypothetical protein OHA68_43325 [Nonomuraea glycinis]
MLVLAAPRIDDPRDDGFNRAVPGELLYRPFVCASGQERNCGCEQQWGGIASSKATTVAEVVDKSGMTRSEYLNTIALYLAETWEWDTKAAVDEAQELAAIAEHFGSGALVTIDIDGNGSLSDELRTDHG